MKVILMSVRDKFHLDDTNRIHLGCGDSPGGRYRVEEHEDFLVFAKESGEY